MVTNLSDEYKEIVPPAIPEFNPNPKLAKDKSETEVVSFYSCFETSILFVFLRQKRKKKSVKKEENQEDHEMIVEVAESSSPDSVRREKKEIDTLVSSSPELKLSRPKKKKEVSSPPKLKLSHPKDTDSTGSSSPEMVLSRPKRATKETKSYKVCSYANSAFLMALMKYFE